MATNLVRVRKGLLAPALVLAMLLPTADAPAQHPTASLATFPGSTATAARQGFRGIHRKRAGWLMIVHDPTGITSQTLSEFGRYVGFSNTWLDRAHSTSAGK